MEPIDLYRLGISSIQNGKTEEGVNFFKQAIILFPENPLFYFLLGKLSLLKLENKKAEYYFSKALFLDPGNIDLHYGLAILYKKNNNFPKAIFHLNQIIKINPDIFHVYYYLAEIMNENGDFNSAIRNYEKAIKLNENSFESYNNMAKIMIDQGDFKNARKSFQKALSLKPDSPEILNNLGFLNGELKNWNEEIKYYQKAIETDPNFNVAYLNLAKAYERQGKIEEAQNCYMKVFETEPENLIFKFHIDIMCPLIPLNKEEIEKYRNKLINKIDQIKGKVVKIDFNNLLTSSFKLPYNLVYQGRDDIIIKKKYAEIYQNIFPSLIRKLNTGKPNIGIVVTKDHEPIFCKSMRGILNNISLEKFNITIVFNNPPAESYLRQQLNNSGIGFLGLNGDFSNIMKILSEKKFDILYYWEVDTDTLNYFLPFCRFAPVQCTSWGWQVTTGIPNMDFYLSCELIETENSQSHYSEKLIKFKSLPVYYYRPTLPLTLKGRKYFDLSENQNIYICSQNLLKIHPDFDNILAKILRFDKNACLVLINDKHENITKLLYKRIKNYFPDIINKIKFVARMNEQIYLNLISLCDVALDTIYYGGVNTTYDAIACGTPIITMPTQFQRGRYTYGVYKTMGIYDCIAGSEIEYISQAVKIANNKQLRNEISEKIKKRDYLIFENPSSIVELSEFFESVIWENKMI